MGPATTLGELVKHLGTGCIAKVVCAVYRTHRRIVRMREEGASVRARPPGSAIAAGRHGSPPQAWGATRTALARAQSPTYGGSLAEACIQATGLDADCVAATPNNIS